jgi:GTP-binding protein
MTVGNAKQFPRDPRPEIALSGRSNVGKSSLINTLLGRKSLARVSSAPGKTITINYYDIDKKLFLVDLPGYGYAKRSKESKKSWSSLTEDYFIKNPSSDAIKLVIQLIDIRTGPTEDDVMMINWLIDQDVPFIVVATKTDKLNKTDKKTTQSDDYAVDCADIDFDYLCQSEELVLNMGKATTNVIQRHLKIGFNRAANLVERLEELGFVSAAQGSKPRDVLIDWKTYQEWRNNNAK